MQSYLRLHLNLHLRWIPFSLVSSSPKKTFSNQKTREDAFFFHESKRYATSYIIIYAPVYVITPQNSDHATRATREILFLPIPAYLSL